MSSQTAKLLKHQPTIQSIRNKATDYSIKFPANSRWTKQSFAAECDINTIMSRYQSTGEMPVINQLAPQYMDCPADSFQDMLNFVKGAEDLFASLPAKIRTRFGNNPSQFLEFMNDESNHAEAIGLGLIVPDEKPTETPVEASKEPGQG